MSSRCNSCGAKLVWAKHPKSGKPVPLDAEPVQGGDIEVVDGVARPVKEEDRIVPLFRAHRATCPKKFHRRKSP